MEPFLFGAITNQKVLCHFQQGDKFIVKDILNTLLHFRILHYFIKFFLNFYILCHFDVLVYFFGKGFKFLYFLVPWEFVFPKQGTFTHVFNKNLADFSVRQEHILLHQKISSKSLFDVVINGVHFVI